MDWVGDNVLLSIFANSIPMLKIVNLCGGGGGGRYKALTVATSKCDLCLASKRIVIHTDGFPCMN